MSKKNKAQKAAKARQRGAERSRERAKNHTAKVAARLNAQKKATGVRRIANLPDADYLYWLCHGANYIASDYEKGLWTPIFDIYEGERLPEPESIAQTVMNRYSAEHENDESAETWSTTAKAVLAWTLMDTSVVSIYAHEAKRRLEKIGSEDAATLARQPYQPNVWEMFQMIKTRLQQQQAA